MPKPKKPKLKVFLITESIHISYEVVAESEEAALNHYQTLPTADFLQLLDDSASNNFGDEEIEEREDYDPEEHSHYPKA